MTAFARGERYRARRTEFVRVVTHESWRVKLYWVDYENEAPQQALFGAGVALALASLPLPAVTATRPGVGFCVMHRGDGADYVVLGYWERRNELPLSTFVRYGDTWSLARDREAVCVWDLAVAWFERNSFVERMLAPEAADLEAYLEDRYSTVTDFAKLRG